MQKNSTVKIVDHIQDLRAIFSKLSNRRRWQLCFLLVLQIIGAGMEVVSLGLILPFLGALSNADEMISRPDLSEWLDIINITTPTQLIIFMAVLFGSAAVLVNFIRVFTVWVQARLASEIGSDLSIELFRRTLYQSFEFHTSVNSGTLISTVTNDLRVTLGMILSILMIVTQGLAVIAIFIALLVYNAQVALVMGGIIFLTYIIVDNLSKARLYAYGVISSDKTKLRIKVLQESWGGIRDILLDGTQKAFISNYSQADRSMRRANANSSIIKIAPRYVLEAAGIVILVSISSFLAYKEDDFRTILPLLGGMAMATMRLLPAVQQIYYSYAGIKGSHISIMRTLEFLQRPLDSVAIANTHKNIQLKSSLSLDNVSFHYGNYQTETRKIEWVLENINITIPVNTTVALVGVTGSGKSTIADIILGLLKPQKGTIRVNGKVLGVDDLAAWRNTVAHVPQSIYLSDSTIMENIAFGVSVNQIDMERVKDMASAAGIANFIEKRQKGYNEIVGERGIRLSGGQRQRIGIARALYKNASVIVFDEATSSLDNETERAVMKAIEELQGKKTIILIAHRLSTVKNANVIYEINAGQVVASGSFDELLEKSASFRRLVVDLKHTQTKKQQKIEVI